MVFRRLVLRRKIAAVSSSVHINNMTIESASGTATGLVGLAAQQPTPLTGFTVPTGIT
jgi:hypothetical protein